MLNLPNVKAVIKKLLDGIGLELRQRRSSLSKLQSYPLISTSGTTIEFIGTQGIGKTTLYNALPAPIKKRWFFRGDLLELGPNSVSSGHVEQLHRDIYFRKIHRVNTSQLDPWQSITVARQMATVIYESLMISSHYFPRGFLLEEGLFKNFPEEVLELSDDEAAPLWGNRAFVYLCARDLDVAVARFQRRTANRRNCDTFQHHLSNSEVRSRIEADNLLYDRIIEKAQAFACQSIILFAEDNFQSSVNNVLEFERSLNSGIDQ
jgi:hypothetical protein